MNATRDAFRGDGETAAEKNIEHHKPPHFEKAPPAPKEEPTQKAPHKSSQIMPV